MSIVKRIKKPEENTSEKQEIRIGVFGLHSCCGTTHISILLAWYLSEFLGKRVVYVNLSDNNDISSLKKYYKVKVWEEKQIFSCQGITFIEHGSLNHEEWIKEETYDYCIMDLGSNVLKAMKKLVYCDRRIAVGNVTPWKLFSFEVLRTLLSERREVSSFRVIQNLANTYRLQEELPVKSYCIGLEPELFHPSKRAIKVFEEVLFS